MNGKKITFSGDLDSFKTKDKGVTIQIKATTDNLSLDKLHRIDANGQRETKYTATTKDGSVYGLAEDLYENLKLQMPEEPEEPVDIGDVPEDSDAEPENDNGNNKKGIDLFGINPETKKIEQVTE